MRRLSYSKAEAYSECAKKGWALHTRQMPDRTGDAAERILVGQVVDRVAGQALEERWYEKGPSPDEIVIQARQSMEFILVNETPFALTPAGRSKLYERLEGLRTIKEQIVEFGLVPTTQDDLRLQVKAERPIPDINTTITGHLDVLLENSHGITLIDVKAGTYRKPAQLMWYMKLLEALGHVPSRVGFWMPLRREIEWRPMAKLPNITPMILGAVHKIETQDQTPEPGSQCRMCPIRPVCNEGIKYMQSCETANSRLLTPPGIHRVEW